MRGCVAALVGAVFACATAAAFERTEKREACADYDPLRRPLFGDLHVHTRLSFDSMISSQRNGPDEAYRYAQGEPVTLPDEDGQQTIVARIGRPLDFTAVTDHSEYLGPIGVCSGDPWTLGYWWPHCVMSRSDIYLVQLLAAHLWTESGVKDADAKPFLCSISDCDAVGLDVWNSIQAAAERHYDRSDSCRFTTFVGYEYTDAPDFNNLHRNVIFRNERVTGRPISARDTGPNNFPELWRRLREECIEADAGCDVLAIPHNSNLSGGLMFRDPLTPLEASERLFFEPVVELTQHKASSECRFDRIAGRGVDTEDELCDFEQARADNLSMLGTVHGEVRTEQAREVPIDAFGRRNMVRNALKDGLALRRTSGLNPFMMGFIGSTDTHRATPGGAEESNYTGHLGRRDAGYRNVQDHFFDNPGGLAVVWAEENSRDAIFEGLRRRETYATSGTRPTVRFFGGWNFPDDACGQAELVARGYADGVPMGGVLPPAESAAPVFIVSAQKDAGIEAYGGTDLQRLQIIKGWVDAQGTTHEQVIDVAGDADNGADVDPRTCRPRGAGARSLCAVWRDPAFDASQDAFYYVRVLENPSCRWSTLQCKAAGVDPFSPDCEVQAGSMTALAQERGAIGDVYGRCCLAAENEPFYSPVIQERAWTSPIWYQASGSPQ